MSFERSKNLELYIVLTSKLLKLEKDGQLEENKAADDMIDQLDVIWYALTSKELKYLDNNLIHEVEKLEDV